MYVHGQSRYFFKVFVSNTREMSQEQCISCGLRNSIYGKFCGECQHCGLLPLGNHAQAKCDGLLPLKKKKKRKILSTLDILISVFIVTPLVVACWRGTWQLMDIYADYFPPWESFIIGTLIHIVVGISQESFNGLVNQKHKSWISNTLACLFMKLYTIVLNAVTNMHWRGAWIIVDEYFGITHTATGELKVENVRGSVSFFAICFLIMVAMRCLRNLNSPPFGICMDYGDDMFLFPTMFKVKVSEKISLYILDAVFSISVVTNLGIVVWRGLWLLIDVYYFLGDETCSAWGSLVIGYVMVAIVFLLQSLMKKLCDNLSGIPRLLVADAYMMFAVMAVIFVWRGIWNLLNIYFMPDDELLSCWICLCIPMVILIAMGCSNSLLVRGVCLDCEEPDGTCVVFPCNYLKDIFDQEKYDTWFKIWSGVSKKKKDINLHKNMINVINYHVVKMNDADDDAKNNNNTDKIGFP